MKVNYIGHFYDITGYGEAARNCIIGLYESGVKLKLTACGTQKPQVSFGRFDKIAEAINEDPISDFNIQIIHTQPCYYARYIDRTKYNIGYTLWETRDFPNEWKTELIGIDELWTANTISASIFQRAVAIPVKVFPHCVDIESIEASKELNLDSFKNKYVFGTVGQYTARKNFENLILAFYLAFSAKDIYDKVILVIKTWWDFTDQSNEAIVAHLGDVKNRMKLSFYPVVYIIGNKFDYNDNIGFLKSINCYVSMSRGESFGIPILEAMACGKPVITSLNDGPKDFVPVDYNEFIDTYDDFVTDMQNFNYCKSDYTWQHPDRLDASRKMRKVFDNRELYTENGLRNRNVVQKVLSTKVIGSIIKESLEKIGR